MSSKSKRNAKPGPAAAPERRAGGGMSRGAIFLAAVIALVAAFAVAAMAWRSHQEEQARQLAARSAAHLQAPYAPTLGNAEAKVHVVEFLDPACETCAAMYPHVKKLMAENPGRIKLSVRHVPFHEGSDQVVRALEAAKSQDRYWQALEALFASQERWTVNHRVYPERIWPFLEGLGLDLERVRREMNAADIAARVQKDMADAAALKVEKTPEYFVNGRPLPRFGLEELQKLVREEVGSAYR
jgi:protein-disulfide isomerase